MMKEFVDKLISRLEEIKSDNFASAVLNEPYSMGICHTIEKSIKIVNQLAEEYNNGWIPCEMELPKVSNSYLVTKMCENEDNPIYETAHEIFWTNDGKWDCERDEYCEWKVIAWQNKFAPYQPKGE